MEPALPVAEAGAAETVDVMKNRQSDEHGGSSDGSSMNLFSDDMKP